MLLETLELNAEGMGEAFLNLILTYDLEHDFDHSWGSFTPTPVLFIAKYLAYFVLAGFPV